MLQTPTLHDVDLQGGIHPMLSEAQEALSGCLNKDANLVPWLSPTCQPAPSRSVPIPVFLAKASIALFGSRQPSIGRAQDAEGPTAHTGLP